MHIVHLEDDKPLVEILRLGLLAVDPEIEIKQCNSSDEALAYVERNLHDIDLFVLDVRVPGTVSGMAVAKRIRDLGCDKSIVVTSAYEPPRIGLLQQLNCEWLAKPWHVMEASAYLCSMARQGAAV